jgi:hypothetical protein
MFTLSYEGQSSQVQHEICALSDRQALQRDTLVDGVNMLNKESQLGKRLTRSSYLVYLKRARKVGDLPGRILHP